MSAAELAEQLERLDALFVELYNYAESQSLSDTMSKSGANALRAIKGSIGNRYNVIPQAAARLRSMEEALTETLEVAARHRRVALDYKYGTKADEKLPTDREWDATCDRVAAALSGEGQ